MMILANPIPWFTEWAGMAWDSILEFSRFWY